MNTTELRKLRFFEALRFVLLFAACMAVLAFFAFTQGCAAESVARQLDRALAELHSQAPATTASTEGTERPDGAQASSDSAPTAPSVDLDFRYGGFKGSKATEDSRCRISKLKIGSDSLSFHWDTKIPGDWQRGDTKKGPMIVIAAFYQDSSGRWIGGKFDWIDESRSSRSLENIKGGYGGWDGTSWTAAKKHAVCVVSADGKFRSNLLTD